MALLSGYAGWKLLGVVPCLMVMLVGLAVSGGREEVVADANRGWFVNKGVKGESVREGKREEVKETGVRLRRREVGVQVVE